MLPAAMPTDLPPGCLAEWPADLSGTLLSSMKNFPQGLTVAHLQAMQPGISRRTLQRWLARLAAQGQIMAYGDGRGRRYFPRSGPLHLAEPEWDFPTASIPLSVDSEDILSYIERPLQARNPVGYHRDLLDAYRPGVTWYLPAPLRHQLRNMGDTGESALPAGTYGRAILDRLLVDLSWASSYLEGNTYTWLDTRELIERGKAAHGKEYVETRMILNHKRAIEMLVENVDSAGYDRYTLCNVHAALSEGLMNNVEHEGRLRQHMVWIGHSVYRPLSVPAQIEEALDVLLDKAGRIPDPFEQSFFLMVHLPYLQPFGDVNKRTSRLMASLPLIKANLCPMTFVGVPRKAYINAVLGVYEMTRVELLRDLYMWAYGRSTQAYLTIKRDVLQSDGARPDPLRLAYRDLINETIHLVVTHPDEEPLDKIRAHLSGRLEEPDRGGVEALVVACLRALHEGVLYRYGLRASHLQQWQARRRFL
jgi:fido (protein-threonine AMPylation protein)